MNSPATFVCQKCGHVEGEIWLSSESKERGVIEFICKKCNKEFTLPRLARTGLSCPFCGFRIIVPLREVLFSQVTIEMEKPIKEMVEEVVGKKEEGKKKEVNLEIIVSEAVRKKIVIRRPNSIKVKIIIPYYSGNDLINRAVRSWIIPEVVFAMTDEGVIPPGWGVCHQFFTNKNSKKEGLHPTKTKPFLIDILKNLIKMFPDEEYYGYFNSDIILPPGSPVDSLLPSKRKEIVFHHRQDLVGDKEGKSHPSKLDKGNQVCVGKDGFIANKRTIEMIIEEVPDMVIGAPCWDDGLLVWCWKKFGVERVELRYGNIWHIGHKEGWKFGEPDDVFNVKQLTSAGVTNEMRYSINWRDVNEKTPRQDLESKTLGIIQPGRIGDIIIVLPIAKWYYDRGYKVLWPVCSEYFPLFDYINYAEPEDIGGNISESYNKSKEFLVGKRVDKILDLGIGFGREEKDWIESGLHFNEWKYKEAGVPLKERFNLQICRDFVKENQLWEYVEDLYNLDGRGYSVIHDSGTKGPFKFSKKGVKVENFSGYTVFDWIGIIEKANHLYCVDSCVANLADQLGLCVGNREVYFWQGIPDPNPKRKELGFPKLSEDWKVVSGK